MPKKGSKALGSRRKKHPGSLTPKMYAVLAAALEGACQDNIAAIARKAKVREATVHEWQNKRHDMYSPEFCKAWDGLFDEVVGKAVPTAILALKRKAQSGDVQAIKLILELSKKYQPSWLKVEASGNMSLEELVIKSMNGKGGSDGNGKS